MNLIGRMILTLIAAVFKSRLDLLDTSRARFRVWPHDLDVNMHLNNGRYLTLMDLGRLDLLVRVGALSTVLRRRWMPVLGGATIRFRRSIGPFERFTLATRILCWDDKWVYMEQRFERNGTVAAVAYVRGTFKSANGTVPPTELAKVLGHDTVSPPMPAGVAAWAQSEDAMRAELAA